MVVAIAFLTNNLIASHELFAIGKRYQFVAWAYLLGFLVPVPFWIAYKLWPKLRTDYLYTPLIWYASASFVVAHFLIKIYSYYIGWLCVGINSSIFSYFSIAYISQWYLRTRYPRWFVKYNYVLAAALDGGTQVRIGSSSTSPTALTLSVGYGLLAVLRSFRCSWKFPPVPAMVRVSILRRDSG